MRLSYLEKSIEWVNMNYAPLVHVLGLLWMGGKHGTKSSKPSSERQGNYIVPLLRAESWRGDHGSGSRELCTGGGESLRFDDSPYWHCTQCGRISRLQFVAHTVPRKSP